MKLLIFILVLIPISCRTLSPKANDPVSLVPGDTDRVIEVGGLSREFRVHLPAAFDLKTPKALVVALHGGGGDIQSLEETSKLNAASDEFGFVLVYPQGTGKTFRGRMIGAWNAGNCCGTAKTENVDDVGFLSQLIDFLVQSYGVDPVQVYVTGHSNGAQMSYRLACELSDKVAAIAPVGAQNVLAACGSKRKVPVLHAHGKLDPCTPFNGGTCGGCWSDFLNKLGVDKPTPTWSCDSVPRSVEKWRATAGPVELVAIENMGHTWPGGALGSLCKRPGSRACIAWKETIGPLSDYPFNRKMWEFFKRNPRR